MDTERVNTEVRREDAAATERRGFGLRRAAALVVYVAGGLWALGALQASLSALWARDFAVAVVWLFPAVAGWWLTAGVGIRLGVSPRDFLAWLAAGLGFSSDRRPRDSD
jgi:hypothetical protein